MKYYLNYVYCIVFFGFATFYYFEMFILEKHASNFFFAVNQLINFHAVF